MTTSPYGFGDDHVNRVLRDMICGARRSLERDFKAIRKLLGTGAVGMLTARYVTSPSESQRCLASSR